MKAFELAYWIKHRSTPNTRSKIMTNLFGDVEIFGDSAVDVGCGPRCGIFNELKFNQMYGVDPLWKEYAKNNLTCPVKGVQQIRAFAEDFQLKEKVDVAFSFNALDHSGNLEKSFDNIFHNLKEKGKLYFHIHLRTKDQLNVGHQMIIKVKNIYNIIDNHRIVYEKILSYCPLDNKKYKTFIGIVEK